MQTCAQRFTPSELVGRDLNDSTFILACPEVEGIGEQGGVSTYRVINFLSPRCLLDLTCDSVK